MNNWRRDKNLEQFYYMLEDAKYVRWFCIELMQKRMYVGSAILFLTHRFHKVL